MVVETTPVLRMIWPNTQFEVDLAPLQGLWSVEQYLTLSEATNQLIEFTDGVIELLPMPTREHQKILAYLYRRLFPIIEALGGIVLFAPLRVLIRPGKFREPDLLVLLNEQDGRNQNDYWLGADLVIEIVSPDKPQRDTEQKRREYAEVGIPEYWIVNPMDETTTVLTLVDGEYANHGLFRRGEQAVSQLLGTFVVNVDAVFDAR